MSYAVGAMGALLETELGVSDSAAFRYRLIGPASTLFGIRRLTSLVMPTDHKLRWFLNDFDHLF
jgi:hypothetical protein